MNKQRRKELEEVLATLEGCKDTIEYLRDEEQSAFENMPEQFQESEVGEKMQEIADALDDAVFPVEEAIDALQEIVDNL